MKSFCVRFSASLVCLTLSTAAIAVNPTTVEMEAYGDSLTAGFLSGTNVARKQDLKDVSSIVSDLAMYVITKNTDYLKAHHRPDLAWPALYAKSLSDSGETVALQNVAVSGARTFELPGQVQRVRTTNKPAMAFFYMGHNDLCHSSGDPDVVAQGFVGDYEAGIREWDAKHTNSTAYFLPVSRMDLIYQTLDGHVWYEGPKAKYTCKDSWEKLFPYCPKYYRLAKQGKLAGVLVPKIRAMNQALKDAVHQWNKSSVNHNEFKFLSVPETLNIGPDFFAIDCYHLSDVGQTVISEQVAKQMY